MSTKSLRGFVVKLDFGSGAWKSAVFLNVDKNWDEIKDDEDMSLVNYFSHSRTPSLEELGSNACHEAWEAYLKSGKAGFDLSGSNPTRVGLPCVGASREGLDRALSASYQASAQGLDMARQAIADFYQGQTSADRIQLFASTSEAIGCLVKLFCSPSDEVVTCIPTYPLLDCLCSLESVRLLEIPLQDCAGQWAIDFWTLERTCTEKTRLMIVVSPNNPTGHCILFEEMSKLVDFCAERGMALVVDEVFASYRLDENPALLHEPAAAQFDRGLIISLSGLSKVCGQPQHKLGWGVFGGDRSVVSEAMQRMSFITDSTLSVSGWVQRMSPEFIENRHIFHDACMERIRENLEFLKDYARRDGVQWTVDRVQGGWSACVRLPGWADDEAASVCLAKSGVRVFPGLFFGYRETQPTLVVSLITETEIFRDGVERLGDVLRAFLGGV